MKGDYELLLSGSTVRSLLAVTKRSRRKAEQLIEAVAQNPFRDPDFQETGASGRSYSVFVEADVVLTIWVDHAVKELRVVQVEFV